MVEPRRMFIPLGSLADKARVAREQVSTMNKETADPDLLPSSGTDLQPPHNDAIENILFIEEFKGENGGIRRTYLPLPPKS